MSTVDIVVAYLADPGNINPLKHSSTYGYFREIITSVYPQLIRPGCVLRVTFDHQNLSIQCLLPSLCLSHATVENPRYP